MRKKLFTFLLALAASVGLSWATDPVVISTNTGQPSYTQGDITITCSRPGTDSDGFYLEYEASNTATITNSGSSTISQIELSIGWFPQNRSYVRANGAEPTSSDQYSITFTNVNSNNVTLTITNEKIQIRNVTITLADEGGSAQAGLQVTELQIPPSWQNDQTPVTASDLPGFVAASYAEAGAWTAPTEGTVKLIYTFDDGVKATYFNNGVWGQEYVAGFGRWLLYSWASYGERIFYTSDGSTPAVDPEPTPAEPTIVITTNTSQSSYTQGNITITCSKPGDNDGFYLDKYDNETATITVSGSSTISQIELSIGWYPQNRSYVRANGAEPTSSDQYSITFSNVNSNNVTLTITDEKIQIRNVTITLADEGGSTPAVDPTPTPSATGGIFANCYDCWRVPEYPNISGQCHLFNFGNPGVGNKNPSGPWKLEFVEYYNSSSTEYDDIVSSSVANQYGKSPEQMEVYRLYQWQNGAYQPVAYGVLYAYANESNPVEHAAFFEANGYWGCYLTGNTHSDGDDFNITFNEDASTGFADLHGAPTPTPDPDPEPTPTPSGDGDKLAGAFSVSGTKVVYFSKGNLQATTSDQGATWTWGFAENQWDYVGNAAANTSFDYWGGTGNGSYDLFGWIGESSALTDYRQYGIGSNYDFTDCGDTAGEDLKADWGSLMGSDWRTLTYDEWQYLIKSRNNAANLLAYATVNGKTGLILLPDSWTSSSVALTITTANYTTNIISASDWSTLEEQGCVFLPAAGWRSDDSVSGVGEGGDYWSSSSPSGKQYDEGSAYCFFFDTDFSKQADGMHFNKRGRGYGLSVRLVSETAPSGGSTPAVDPAVQNVIDLINAIPNPVVYNQDCYNALNAVYDAYVALSEEQRDQVTNYDDYLEAEERYYMLGSVNYVIEKINEIGNVEFTPACKHRIDYARSEYCSLTLEQKGYVTNYNTLLAAEAAYAALIPVSSTVVWDEAILETIDADEWGEATYTNGSLSLKAVDGRARYVDIDDHFIFDGSNSEKSFVFSCTSANMLCIEITVSEKHQHNELSCAWQETATGYRWVGEATSVDLASTIFKVTGIRFSLGEAFPEPTPTPAQDGDKLPGAFSVSGEKVVYFSKGNLQYLGNIDRWHFAENQWTIIGNAQASNNRDLFSWGTGDNPDSEDYSTYTEWGNNIEGNWRTLTVDEWTYLFNTRTGASSKYGTSTVAGVEGLILLPDNYDGTAINSERTAWDNNVINSSDWVAYEAAGAVFLPAAGLSDAYGVYGVGEQGFYWSSTMDALSHYAIAVFYGFNPYEGYWFNQVDAQFQPQDRLSVRLVSETAPTPAPVGPVADLSKNIAIDLRGQQLGDAAGGSKYLIIDSEDNYTYVDDEPAAYNAHFAFDNFNGTQHGYTNLLVTAPVEAGQYLLTLGGCQYGNGAGNVKNAASEILVEFDQKTAGCYDADPVNNSVYLIFTVDAAQTITIDCGNYTPYIALKKMPEIPAFTDFELNFQTNPYDVISGAKPEGTVIAGSFHDGQHGYQNVEATVPMEAGTYRLTLGACGYGNGAGNVLSETNVELAAFNQKLAEESMCYVASTGANTVSVTFTVDIDQTITIDCGQYTPYMKLEKITAYHVVFALGDAEGVAPAAADVTIGEDITMPVNKTLYKEGYTLTGWSDGVNTYPIGQSFTPANDVVLTPVFTANEADLLNASTDVTVKWYFGGDNGAPTTSYEGTSGLLVAQATIGDKTVDVKLAIDATSGKFAPQSTTEWANVKVGTIFTYPYKEGMTVNVGNYKPNVTYYIADAEGKVTCVENDYYSFIEVTYPATTPTDEQVPTNADPENPSYHYSTFFHSTQNYKLTNDGTEAFIANLSAGDLVLTRIASGEQVIPANTAVIFRKSGSADPVVLNPTEENGVSINPDDNDLQGVDEATTLESLSIDPLKCYVLSGKSHDNTVEGVGFYRIYGTILKAHKAYVIYNGSVNSNLAPRRMRFVFNQTTDIENVSTKFGGSEKILRDGQLIILKNGVMYNAQGQIVK